MAITSRSSILRATGILAAAFLLAAVASGQVSEQVLHSFTALNGSDPRSNLIADTSGNFYGTTTNGGLGGCGKSGCGTAYELLLEKGGTWKFMRIYTFDGAGDGGFAPYGNLVFDAAGNLYGTASGGGQYQLGTVYKLTPGNNGTWTETPIHAFAGVDAGDGAYPYSGLTEDAAGNLYGTTSEGGVNGNGILYELSPNADGSWSETVLYSFTGANGDGADPLSEVTFDGAGNLYGTAADAGEHGFGTVFKVSPSTEGWTETTIYSFTGKDLAVPRAPVWFDSAGNIYGAACGESPNWGAVYELTNSAGTWSEITLHRFVASSDGRCPISALTPDANGDLYGTAGGGANGDGVIYKLAKGSSGAWAEKVIYSFAGGSDGSVPWAGLTPGKGGIFYGTTTEGGTGNYGVVYKIKP